MTTYTLDARTPDGAYASDSGLTAVEVANARANAAHHVERSRERWADVRRVSSGRQRGA